MFVLREAWAMAAFLAVILAAGGAVPALPASRPGAAGPASAAAPEDSGVIVHTLHSPRQTGPTKVRVLLPRGLEGGVRCRALYILPVEAGDGRLLLGYGNFRPHHQAIRGQLLAAGIPHLYRDGPPRKHHWAGGWVEEAVEFLAETQGPFPGKRH